MPRRAIHCPSAARSARRADVLAWPCRLSSNAAALTQAGRRSYYSNVRLNCKDRRVPAAPSSPARNPHRILDVAEELFMQHGFEGASMRMLTAKAASTSPR